MSFLKLNELQVLNQSPLNKSNDGPLKLIYFNDNHLNEVGVRYYAQYATKTIEKNIN